MLPVRFQENGCGEGLTQGSACVPKSISPCVQMGARCIEADLALVLYETNQDFCLNPPSSIAGLLPASPGAPSEMPSEEWAGPLLRRVFSMLSEISLPPCPRGLSVNLPRGHRYQAEPPDSAKDPRELAKLYRKVLRLHRPKRYQPAKYPASGPEPQVANIGILWPAVDSTPASLTAGS